MRDCLIKILPLEKEELRNALSYLLGNKLSNYNSVFKTFLRFKFGLSKVTLV